MKYTDRIDLEQFKRRMYSKLFSSRKEKKKKKQENLLGLVVVESGRFYLPDACVYILNVLTQPHEYYFKMANDLLLKPE